MSHEGTAYKLGTVSVSRVRLRSGSRAIAFSQQGVAEHSQTVRSDLVEASILYLEIVLEPRDRDNVTGHIPIECVLSRCPSGISHDTLGHVRDTLFLRDTASVTL